MARGEKKPVQKYVRIKTSDDQMVVEFRRTGNRYRYTGEGVAAAAARAARRLDCEIDPAEAEKAVQARLAELAEENGLCFARPAVDAGAPDGKDWADLAEDYAARTFGQTAKNWNGSVLGESDSPAEALFQEEMDGSVYSQDMQKLDPLDVQRVVLVRLPCGPCYFYNTGEFANGYQIWRPALGPLARYGVRA